MKVIFSDNNPFGPVFGSILAFFAGLSTHDIFKAVFLGIIGGAMGYLGQWAMKSIISYFRNRKHKKPYQ